MISDPVVVSLPAAVAQLVERIDQGEVLGASRQLTVLGDCLLGIAEARSSDSLKLRTDVAVLVEHIQLTRGASSRAVTNGMSLMTDGLVQCDVDADVTEQVDLLVAGVQDFRRDLTRWLATVRGHGVRVLSEANVVLAYDYSSTVAQVLSDVAGGRKEVCVFVPEARSLNGGLKYLADWRHLGLTVHLIPDSAISWALRGCDAVLVGAETLSGEGGCYNTIGTAPTAAEAARVGVPVHVLSVLLKTDTGPASAARPTPSLDFLRQLKLGAPQPDGSPLALRGDFPDLDYTPPSDITSVVTEFGVLAPAEIEAAAGRVLSREQPDD